MFGYNYKFEITNPEKNIVKLAPTTGTYMKAIVPSVVAAVVWAGLATYANRSLEKTWNEAEAKLNKFDEEDN